ncbi:MAG: AI-2E family transporter [Phycisphaerales bacterium]
MTTAGNTFSRHRPLILLIVGLIIVFSLLYALRSAIVPFATGLVLAYLLLPLISWIEQRLPAKDRWQQSKRVSLIIIIFVIMLAIAGVLSYFLISAVVNAFYVLVNYAPQFIARGLWELEQFVKLFQQQFPIEVQQQVYDFMLEIGTAAGAAVRGIFLTGVSFIPATFGLIFGFAALPVFLFYLLKDSEKLKEGFFAAFSPPVAEHARNISSIIEGVLGRYIRAQLVLGFVVAYLVFIGLLILEIELAPVLAAFAGVTELIPILGPWIGGITAVIVTLAIVPEKAIWVAVLFLAVQLLENTLLVPRVQGGYMRIHPAIVIVLLVLGAKFAGFWGLILAVPFTAVVVEIYKYVRQNITVAETPAQKPAKAAKGGKAD